jgi:outer membrane protein OmpA-like peptidoglycan-associated protein
MRCTSLCLCFAIFVIIANSQNLLQNPGFEDHLPVDYITTGVSDAQFSTILKHWRSLHSHTLICDCQHERTADEIRSRLCRFDKVKPHAGCTMMELSYMPNCPNYELGTRGCSSYLATKLNAPLEVGEVYEVSFWLNVQPPDEPNYLRHIGFALYPDMIRRPANSMLDGSSFLVDSVKIGEWQRVKWLVRPTCRLQVLVIGAFRGTDGPPVQHNDLYDDVFYVDDVSIQPVAQADRKGKTISPHCRYEAAEAAIPYETEGATCLFPFGDSTLTDSAMAALDSFALSAKANPKSVFLLTGHTDSIGENHAQLSRARAASVLDYLEKTHRLPRLRFVVYEMGKTEPAAHNFTAQGRNQNRRVNISQLELEADIVAYRHVLQAVFDGDKKLAIRHLNTWLLLAPQRKLMWMLYDPRLAPLHDEQGWNPILLKAKKTYDTYKKPLLAFQLDSLWAADQQARTLSYYIENLNAYFANKDSTDGRLRVSFEEDTTQDEHHFAALRQLLDNNGWPKISEVGERAAKTAFLIINHQSDTAIYARYLPILKENCMNGEAAWESFAMMYDRFQVLQGLPQRYGTQFKVVDNINQKLELYPLEDPSRVNEWRERIGLPPM